MKLLDPALQDSSDALIQEPWWFLALGCTSGALSALGSRRLLGPDIWIGKNLRRGSVRDYGWSIGISVRLPLAHTSCAFWKCAASPGACASGVSSSYRAQTMRIDPWYERYCSGCSIDSFFFAAFRSYSSTTLFERSPSINTPRSATVTVSSLPVSVFAKPAVGGC